MTRDDVIRMAKEAGIVSKGLPVGGVKALEAFAKLVAAHESNEWKMKYEAVVQQESQATRQGEAR
jgi:hypothetical protein